MGRDAGHKGDGNNRQVNPQGPTGTWTKAAGDSGGGEQHKTRRQTHACGAGRRASDRGWRGVSVVDIQVGGVLCQEKRWGADVNDRCYDEDRY